MRPFTLLVKPASADCNLNCRYCFYLEKRNLYPESARHRMSDAVLEEMIKSYLQTVQPVYSFGWQGGEPTLMGLDFFKKIIQYQKAYGKSGMTVSNGLQTNATLIDDAMADHFKRYRFLLGCSLDGPPDIHNRYRETTAGGPTHNRVLAGIETLKQHQVEFNILILVSQSNVHRAKAVYRYLVDQGFLYHQYIPCVEFDADGNLEPYGITGPEWGKFLCDIFDIWYPSDTRRVSIRHLDALLLKLVDNQISVCTMGDNCCQYFVVEYNGDIYPCDFFVDPDLRLGNIMEMSWDELLASSTYQAFGGRKAELHEACRRCDVFDLCQGDCQKHRTYGGHPPTNISWLCEGNRAFLRHARVRLDKLTGEVRMERQIEEERTRRDRLRQRPGFDKVGRNDPCPCGSGKKFKKCCGR